MQPKLTTRILKYLLIMSAVIAIAIALIWIALQGYSAPWTGFGDFTKPTSDFTRGKTLWDWMQLFIIPISLSIGVFLLNRSERDNEREIATDRQREAALQTYHDRMADLLLKEKLRTSRNKEVRNVARTRTLTVLRGLDATRKGLVLRFLREAGLINKEKTIVDLTGANLNDADLDLANLSGTNLSGADLNDAILCSTSLNNAKLYGTWLNHADLRDAKLRQADLRSAKLRAADLGQANLSGADLRGADLHYAILSGTSTSGVYIENANLSGANLSGANLRGAKVTNEQLATAKSLKGTTMPDGTIHE